MRSAPRARRPRSGRPGPRRWGRASTARRRAGTRGPARGRHSRAKGVDGRDASHGSCDTLFRFHGAVAFSFGAPEAANLEQFMLAMDTNLKPIVGQQVTLTSANAVAAGPRIGFLIGQATAGACDLTVKDVLDGKARGWLLSGGAFQSDGSGDGPFTDAEIRARAGTAGQERTYLCVPPGSGTRVGIDRDEDGFLDRDEIDAGSDPTDPSSAPGGTTSSTSTTTSRTTSTTVGPGQVFIPIPTKKLTMKDRSTPPSDPNRRKVDFTSDAKDPALPSHITPALPGNPGDPRISGATVAVYNSTFIGGELVIAGLPASGWVASGVNTYKYEGASTDAITRATFKQDQIAFKGGKASRSSSLNEPSQGRVAAAFIVGNTFY